MEEEIEYAAFFSVEGVDTPIPQGVLDLSKYKARNEMLTPNRKARGRVDTKAYFHEPLDGCP
jgi:hypothetical protein